MIVKLYETNAGHLYLVRNGGRVAYRVDDVDGAQFESDCADMYEAGTANWDVTMMSASDFLADAYPRTTNGPRHVATWENGRVIGWEYDAAGYAARAYVGDVEVAS